MRIVIGLSGGMDSATLLGMLLDQGAEVHCCTFTYGSKHNSYENAAAFRIIDYYQSKGMPVKHYFFDLSLAFQNFSSALLKSGGAIPEGHYEAESMKQTVVPQRNIIFASIMSGLAESIGAEKVSLGVHSGDHHIYPDCRLEFIKALDSAIFLSSDGKVQIDTPLIKEDKTSILRIGYGLFPEVPYHLTRTCYKDQETSCGKCGSCQERLEAFNNLNIKDPVNYD